MRKIAGGWWPRVLGRCASAVCGVGSHAGVRVYAYHGVVHKKAGFLDRNFHLERDFAQHVAFFRRCGAISLHELTEVLAGHKKRKSCPVAITFDDGYQNNHLAAEIMDQARLPWAVFVSTDYVGSDTTIWTVALALLILHGDARGVEYGGFWPLTTDDHRFDAFQAIRYHMKSLSSVERQRSLEGICSQFPRQHLLELVSRFPNTRMMTWAELRQLAGAGVTIGSHGVRHEIHHENQLESTCREEARRSKSVLEHELGQSCDVFAFPNGNYRPDSPAVLQEAGYALGFSMRTGIVVSIDEDRYILPRLSAKSRVRDLMQDHLSASAVDT